ncbi:MAG TPA: ArsA-related P-loop ATPase [Thermoanaerobaculia bacterium]|nr:ArsA-related P-loop ATPase [Thermoanaerobaculia bacterium]
MTSSQDLLERLAARKLLVVTGKGGVGKTALAAALGLLLAERGRRVLVIEVDPRESLHQLLGTPPSGGEILTAGLRLSVQNLKPRQVLDGIIEEQVRIRMVARRILESPVYHQLAAGMPGLKELAVIHHAWELVREGRHRRFDLVVLDAPATGHGVTLLAAPRVTAEAIGSGPVARLARELAGLVADPEQCGLVAVTLAEEMPVEEVLELRQDLLRRLDREPELLLVNALYPPFPPGPPPSASSSLRLWQQRRAINEREVERLAGAWAGPLWRLPLVPADRGPALVDALAEALRQGGVES